MFSVVLVFVLLCICLVFGLRMHARQTSKHALPPAYPGKLPIIGHLHCLMTNTASLCQLLISITMDSLKQGGVTYCKFGKICYVITDPEDALTVSNACLQKHFVYSFAKNWLGQGLITSTGSTWHHHRKLLSPAFTVPVIHSFLEVFNEQAGELVRAMDSHVDEAKCDTLPHVRKYTLGTTCLTTFGIRDIKGSSFFTKYMEAIDEILLIIVNRFQHFWQQSEFIYNLWLKKKETEVVTTLNELSDGVIQKYKETSMNGAIIDTSYKPIVDQILQPTGDNALTDLEIREELNTIIVAGFETTSNALAYTLALVGSYPEIQEKVYEEVIQVLGADGDVNKYDLQKLLYTDAVIRESLRLLPPVALIGRYIDKDVKLKNYTLRAGSDCFLLMYGIQRHSLWGPDPEQFKPERWLDPASLPANPNAFAAFSFGKRSCLGKTYALATLKVALAHLVRKYRWTADYTKLQCKIDITMKPLTGYEITLQRRS